MGNMIHVSDNVAKQIVTLNINVDSKIHTCTLMKFTMNMTDKESGQNIHFLILPSTIAMVDKGTSFHCYYVKICRTGVTCILFYTFLINSSEGMFLCLPYIAIVEGRMRNCIFCPLSLSVISIVIVDFCT